MPRRSLHDYEVGAPAAIIIQQGRLLDFIDGITQRPETPEEYVRQEIAKSLVREYGYPRADIAVEFGIKSGSRRPRADLVIFDHGEAHHQDNAAIIVECKSSKIKSTDRREGVGQLKSYLDSCGNAMYGMWTNGLERYCCRKIQKERRRDWVEVPDIPSFGQEEYEERPSFDQLKPATSDALLFAFRRCHNYIAGNQGLQKPEAFWELLKVIFCKIYDERESRSVDFYSSSSERQSLNGQMKVKTRLERLFRDVKRDFSQIFRPAEQVDLTPPVLAYIVSQLQMYSLLDSDIDVKGKAYETIVGSNLRGDRGEFFTPRNICSMTVVMLSPDEKSVTLDPACGTGGFLITVMNHVAANIKEAELRKWGDDDRAERAGRQRMDRFLANFLIGIDLNPNLIKAAKMNMVMNNDGAGGLHQGNSLAPPATWADDLRERQLIGNVDVLVTNPPFGSKIPIDDPATLEQYELGHNWSYDEDRDLWIMGSGIQRSQPPEILFIERCVQFLKPGGGRAGIVLPDGILGSPGLGYVRQWLLKNTRVLASIDLHPDTFQPSTSIQTSILLFERKSAELIRLEEAAGVLNDYDVFMALGDHVGHDKRGNATYVRDAEGNEIVEEYEERVKELREGRAVFKLQTSRRKRRDDNTQDIALKFRAWLSTLV